MKRAERKQIITLACIIAAGIIAGALWGLLGAMRRADSPYETASGQNDEKNGMEADAGAALDSDAADGIGAADEAKTTGSGDASDGAAPPGSGNASDSAETSAGAVKGEDESGEQTFSEQEKEWFMEKGGGQEVSTAELERLYKKLLADDVWKNEGRELRDLLLGDFDGNGQTDMIVMAGSRNKEEWNIGGISFYFGEEPVYVYEKEGCCYSLGFMNPPCVGDIDNDGNAELILEVFNGGNGGAGGRDFIYLRHTGEAWEAIDEPWNMYRNLFPSGREYDAEWYGGCNGAGIDISITCIGEDRYEAYCECLDERVEFDAENSREPELINFGEECGTNSRGFFNFECIEYRGQNALKCMEYLYGEGGIAHGIGSAVFVLVWDGNGGFKPAEWWVESF